MSVDGYLPPIYMLDFAASNNIIVDTIGPEEAYDDATVDK
jgi:hypothetical protein